MNNTHIECLIDISGSMQNTIADVVYGYNRFLDEQRNNMVDDNTTWSLSFFNCTYKNIINYENIDSIPYLKVSEVHPSSTTALLDAIGKTVFNLSNKITPHTTYIVFIMTDGYENSSTEYTIDTIKKIITEKQNIGWKFIFLGANIDAIKVATNLGIHTEGSLTYTQNKNGIENALSSVSASITRVRNGDSAYIAFNDLDRIASLSL